MPAEPIKMTRCVEKFGTGDPLALALPSMGACPKQLTHSIAPCFWYVDKNDQRETFDVICRSIRGLCHFNYLYIDNTFAFEQRLTNLTSSRLPAYARCAAGRRAKAPRLAREPFAGADEHDLPRLAAKSVIFAMSSEDTEEFDRRSRQ
jgi:hypothetical protein